MLDYLHSRGLHDEILHANQIGADPGPRRLTRARGLPARGPAVIFPVLDDHGPIYLQARYLNPEKAGGRKYENPASWVATNPRWARVRTAPTIDKDSRLWICEGLPDALSAAQLGANSLALLGVGLADQRLAAYILQEHQHRSLTIAFDADARGRAAADSLAQDLRVAGHPRFEVVSLRSGDLNAHAIRAPELLQRAFAARGGCGQWERHMLKRGIRSR